LSTDGLTQTNSLRLARDGDPTAFDLFLVGDSPGATDKLTKCPTRAVGDRKRRVVRACAVTSVAAAAAAGDDDRRQKND